MAWMREMLAALGHGLAAIWLRPRHALLAATGFLVAAGTLLVVLTIPAGLERAAARTGLENVAVVLADAGQDETQGKIMPEYVARIGALPGIARTKDGRPAIAPQFVVAARLPRRNGGRGTALVRGVTPAIWEVVGPGVRIAEDERPEPGVSALAAGAIAADVYAFARKGGDLQLPRSSWQVSGEFSANGGLWESEFWGDVGALQAAYNAQGQFTTVWVRLVSPAAFDTFARAMKADPRLRGFPVYRQRAFYTGRIAFLAQFVHVAALAIALVLGLEAILASNNAIGLALRSRRRELALLRAMGFRGGPLFAALLAEALLLAAVCAAVALGVGALALHARTVDSDTGMLSIRFAMEITPEVAIRVFAYTLLLGCAGSILPAWRNLRAPLATALARE